jgi:hypothetical protein
MSRITDRIEQDLGVPGLAAMLAERLEPADLQSLLLDVYRRLAQRRPTSALLAEYTTNRFVHPSKIPPVQMLEWDRTAFAHLPDNCEAIELSPVCPLGASAAMSGLSQDRVLATIRNTEVISDSTNVLALEAAVRRRALKRANARSSEPVHVAASHRLLRTQHYANPALSSHFRVFSLCSAGRDRGSFMFEIESLAFHIGFYLSAVRAFVGAAAPLRVSVTLLGEGATLTRAAETLVRQLRERFSDVDTSFDPDRTAGREYYRTMCFWILSDDVQLADGGFVDWTQRLLGDAKERLLVSGVGSDRVCTMRGPGHRATAGA